MARAAGLALLVLAVAVAAACLAAAPASAGFLGLDALPPTAAAPAGAPAGQQQCAGAVGECGVDEDEELGLGGDGEALRRALAMRQPTNKYISYAALRADQVPCNRRGRSYYSNCASQRPANPYRRGCSTITRCARNVN